VAGNYWQRTLDSRISRRRALRLAGATAAGAAFLAACGGDDENGSSGTDSNLVAQPKDTFAEAKSGGTLKEYVTAEPQTLDPATPVAPLNYISGYIYGTLLNEKPGRMEPPQFELYGDVAESWETSPDRLTITIKIKPNVKWHNKPPVNARTVDIDDVLFSWERYTKLSPVSSLSSNARNPEAPVLSVAAPDRSTLVIKLKEPLSYALNYFAAFGSHTGNMIMMPKETGSGFDPRNQMIGHGPYELASVTPSVGYTVKRFADYYDAKNYALDQIDLPIVTEYSARLAQFKTGSIHRLIGRSSPRPGRCGYEAGRPPAGDLRGRLCSQRKHHCFRPAASRKVTLPGRAGATGIFHGYRPRSLDQCRVQRGGARSERPAGRDALE
jgi:peptide/nickel transport system substrate-binding protein